MVTIFYLFGMVFLFKNILTMASSKKRAQGVRDFIEESRLLTGEESWRDYPPKVAHGYRQGLIGLIMFTWVIIGIFSSQWIAFSANLLIQVIVITPLMSLIRYNRGYPFLIWISSLINVLLALFVIINYFHLDWNLETLIFG